MKFNGREVLFTADAYVQMTKEEFLFNKHKSKIRPCAW